MIWQEHHFTTSSLVTVEMFELSSALSMIQEDTKPLVAIQVFNILSVYYFVRGQLIEAMEKVRATSELVRRHNIRFLSSPDDLWDPLAAPSPEAEEQVCALSYHMYKSIVGHLSLGVPSELGLEYEQEFQSIPVRPFVVSVSPRLIWTTLDALPDALSLIPCGITSAVRLFTPPHPPPRVGPHSSHHNALVPFADRCFRVYLN